MMKVIILNEDGKNKVVRRVKYIDSKQTKIRIYHAKGILDVNEKEAKTLIIQLNSFYN